MIHPGYPKLALYIKRWNQLPFWRPKEGIVVPHTASSVYNNIKTVQLTPGQDLIVLVSPVNRGHSDNEGFYGFYNYDIGFPARREIEKAWHVVPLRAIEDKDIPLTSIYKWKAAYINLPIMFEAELQIIDKQYIEELGFGRERITASHP